MTDIFTLVIRGINNPETELYEAKVSCPSHYKRIHCSVVGCYIPFINTIDYDCTICEIKCVNGIRLINSYDNNNALKSLVFQNLKSLNIDNYPQIEFECENFNNQNLEFSLTNFENGELITHIVGGYPVFFDSPWTLILKCKGLN